MLTLRCDRENKFQFWVGSPLCRHNGDGIQGDAVQLEPEKHPIQIPVRMKLEENNVQFYFINYLYAHVQKKVKLKILPSFWLWYRRTSHQ